NNDYGGYNFFSYVSAVLPEGTYYLRVIENGNDAVIPSYYIDLSVTPATPTATPTPLGPDIYEIDNLHTQAAAISAGETQLHSIHVVNDVDWLTFTVDQLSTVTISTSGVSGDTLMFLYSSAGVPGTYLQFDDNGGIALFSSITRQVPAGTYYVRIQENGQNEAIPSYYVSLDVVPVVPTPTRTPAIGDAYEYDDVFNEAKEILPGAAQQRSLHLTADIDWVKFTLAAEAVITLQASGSTGDAEMRLYDALGVPLSEIYYDNDSGPGLFPSITAQLMPGTYYARVNEYGMNAVIASYSLSLAVAVITPTPTATAAVPDIYETDDVYTSATWLYRAEPQEHSIHSANDTDWFRFSLDATYTVNIGT
ncbi:MAG TPA: PPC domain-containing protein, partial [Candidatus Goldiibacteriota bacterium]|nr:PPC domain-containing protein [Candidatus Goldiibacteriota bacterium]